MTQSPPTGELVARKRPLARDFSELSNEQLRSLANAMARIGAAAANRAAKKPRRAALHLEERKG